MNPVAPDSRNAFERDGHEGGEICYHAGTLVTKMREQVRKFLAAHRRNKLVGKIGRSLGYFWQGFENQDYDVTTNGERFVLQSLAKVNLTATVFDVGAHWGEWASMAAAVLQGTIHSFEVIPATYEKLRSACA